MLPFLLKAQLVRGSRWARSVLNKANYWSTFSVCFAIRLWISFFREGLCDSLMIFSSRRI